MDSEKAADVARTIEALGMTRRSDAILHAGSVPYKASLAAVRDLVVLNDEFAGMIAIEEMIDGIGPWAKTFEIFAQAADVISSKAKGAVRES